MTKHHRTDLHAMAMKAALGLTATLTAGIVQATPQLYSYADWQSSTTNSVSGVITQGSNTIQVAHSGNIFSAQLNGGTNYWTPPSTYTSSWVANAPNTPDIIRVLGGSHGPTHSLTFSQPVTNLVMDWVSLGTPSLSASLTFDQPFFIASQGPGAFGSGTLTQIGSNTLEGSEGYGSIIFTGTFTSLNWTDNVLENWHGFTVGIPDAVPEPATLAALGSGLFGLYLKRRRREKL